MLAKLLRRSIIFFGLSFLLLIAYGFRLFYLMGSGELSSGTQAEAIPFSYSTTNHIVIQVKIDGKLRDFILDSGASNMLFESKADEIELGGYKGPGFGIGFNGGAFLTQIYEIDSFELGSYRFSDVPFEVVDYNLECDDHIYGIIGKETMRHFTWLFEPDSMKITLAPGINMLPSLVGDTIKLSRNPYGHQLFATGKVAGFTDQLLIDTGSNGSISTSHKKLNGLGLKLFGEGSSGLDGISVNKESLLYIDSIDISGHRPQEAIEVTVGENKLPTIGLGYLTKFNFLISWEEKLLILQPLLNKKQSYEGFGFGVRYDEEAGKLKISTLVENSPLNNAGITPGTWIDEINGTRVNSRSDYCNFNSFKSDSLLVKLTGVDSLFNIKKYDYRLVSFQ